jgi:RimJ/RimL family protein N-acetyltransferase
MIIPELHCEELVLRYAENKDLARLVEVSAGVDLSSLAGNRSGPVTSEFIASLLDDSSSGLERTVFTIEETGEIRGWLSCLSATPSDGDLFIEVIVVDRAKRKKKIGSKAASLIIHWANDHSDLATVVAGMDAANEAAQIFWESLEFIPLEEKAGILTMVYQLGEDARFPGLGIPS